MKTILKFCIPIVIAIALLVCVLNIKEYDLYIQVSKAMKIEFANPIDDFKFIINSFEGFNELPSGFSWEAVGKFFQTIIDVLWLPIRLVRTLLQDIICIFNFVLIMIGLQ